MDADRVLSSENSVTKDSLFSACIRLEYSLIYSLPLLLRILSFKNFFFAFKVHSISFFSDTTRMGYIH